MAIPCASGGLPLVPRPLCLSSLSRRSPPLIPRAREGPSSRRLRSPNPSGFSSPGVGGGEREKAPIAAHPLYERLLEAHVACLRVATPVDQLPRIDTQIAARPPPLGPPPGAIFCRCAPAPLRKVTRCCKYAHLTLEYWADAPEIHCSADLYEVLCCRCNE